MHCVPKVQHISGTENFKQIHCVLLLETIQISQTAHLLGVWQYGRFRHARGAGSVDIQEGVLVVEFLRDDGVDGRVLLHLGREVDDPGAGGAVELEQLQFWRQLVPDLGDCCGGNHSLRMRIASDWVKFYQ